MCFLNWFLLSNLGGNCIGCLTTEGYLKIYSFPTLRLLLDIECGLSLADYRLVGLVDMKNIGKNLFKANHKGIRQVYLVISKLISKDMGTTSMMHRSDAFVVNFDNVNVFLVSVLLALKKLFCTRLQCLRTSWFYVNYSGKISQNSQENACVGVSF